MYHSAACKDMTDARRHPFRSSLCEGRASVSKFKSIGHVRWQRGAQDACVRKKERGKASTTTWASVKHAIREDLASRDLAEHRLRSSALENVETLLASSFKNFHENPEQLLAIGKDTVKKRLAELKDNGRLNGAESSVLNDIFHHLGVKGAVVESDLGA
ncbi:MAG: hypothetical protein WBP86_12165, partial [Thiobacillaceae bacterium]